MTALLELRCGVAGQAGATLRAVQLPQVQCPNLSMLAV